MADKQPNSLWPQGARVRADIARWQFWQAQHWHEGCAGFLWENLLKKILGLGDTDPAALKKAEAAFHRDASVLEAHLGKHPYLANDALTLADFSVGSYLHYADAECPRLVRPHRRPARVARDEASDVISPRRRREFAAAPEGRSVAQFA